MDLQDRKLFASAAPYYARYRSGYFAEVYDWLVDRTGLDSDRRVLDVGTGPGTVALRLAARVREIVALDPEAAMLREARRLAAEHGVTNVQWVCDDSDGLSTRDVGMVDLTTIGTAFHWTDRERLLAVLDRITNPGGAVAVLNTGTVGTTDWRQAITRVRERHLGPPPGPDRGWPAHQEVLAGSAFSDVARMTWEKTVTRTVDEVIGLQFSYHNSAPSVFGEQQDRFADELRTELLALDPGGTFDEIVRNEALLAFR